MTNFHFSCFFFFGEIKMDFEKAKAYLSKQNKSGSSLFDHISGIIRKVLEEEPENAFDNFENLSLNVKNSKLKTEINEIQEIIGNENEKVICYICYIFFYFILYLFYIFFRKK